MLVRTKADASGQGRETSSLSRLVINTNVTFNSNKQLDTDVSQRTECGQDGPSTYYRATVFGEVTLTDGVDELLRGEQAFEAMDDSSNE